MSPRQLTGKPDVNTPNPYSSPNSITHEDTDHGYTPSRILLVPAGVFLIGGIALTVGNLILGILRYFTPYASSATLTQLLGHGVFVVAGLFWIASAPYWRRAVWLRAIFYTSIGYFTAAGANLLVKS